MRLDASFDRTISIAVCCSVLQYVLQGVLLSLSVPRRLFSSHQIHCSVLQCIAVRAAGVCCSLWVCRDASFDRTRSIVVRCSVLQYVLQGCVALVECAETPPFIVSEDLKTFCRCYKVIVCSRQQSKHARSISSSMPDTRV